MQVRETSPPVIFTAPFVRCDADGNLTVWRTGDGAANEHAGARCTLMQRRSFNLVCADVLARQ